MHVNLDQTPSPDVVPYRELGIRRQPRTLPRKAEPHPWGTVRTLVAPTCIRLPLINVVGIRGLPSFRGLPHLQENNVVVFSHTSFSLPVSQGLGRMALGRIGLGTHHDSWYNNSALMPSSPPYLHI